MTSPATTLEKRAGLATIGFASGRPHETMRVADAIRRAGHRRMLSFPWKGTPRLLSVTQTLSLSPAGLSNLREQKPGHGEQRYVDPVGTVHEGPGIEGHKKYGTTGIPISQRAVHPLERDPLQKGPHLSR